MRIQDCITTINAVVDDLVELIAAALAEHLDDLDADLSKKIVGLDAKVAVLQRETRNCARRSATWPAT